MAREVGEVRKRLGEEPDPSSPYVSYARKLLGELKEDMARNGLQQGVRRRSIPIHRKADGGDSVFIGDAIIEVSSAFGQDTIDIKTPKYNVGGGGRVRDEFVPYLWVGARLVDQERDDVTVHLNVWEPGEHDVLADSIVSTRDLNINQQDPTDEFPLGGMLQKDNGEGTEPRYIFYNKNNLIAYEDYVDSDDVTWNNVVIGDDDPGNPDMHEFVTRLLEGIYFAGVCLTGDECDEHDPVEIEVKVVAGKYKHRVEYKKTFTISKVSNFNRSELPYGYFAGISDQSGVRECERVIDDHGENPHWDNWVDETISIYLPARNSDEADDYSKLRIKKASIGETDEWPPGFEDVDFEPQLCNECEPFFVFHFSPGNAYYWTYQCIETVPIGSGFYQCVAANWQYFYSYNDQWDAPDLPGSGNDAPTLREKWNEMYPNAQIPPFPTEVYRFANLYNGDNFCTSDRSSVVAQNRGMRSFPRGPSTEQFASGSCTEGFDPGFAYLGSCELMTCVASQSTVHDPNISEPKGTEESNQVGSQNTGAFIPAGDYSPDMTHSVATYPYYFEVVRPYELNPAMPRAYFWNGPKGYNLYNKPSTHPYAQTAQIVGLPW